MSPVFIIMMIALTAAAPFFIVFGALSDRIGRRNIMATGFCARRDLLFGRCSPWLGTFKEQPGHPDHPVCSTWSSLVTMVYGPIAAFLVEAVPGTHPLHLDVAALPRREWRVRRPRPLRRRLDRRADRHRPRRIVIFRWRSRRSGSSSASASCANRTTM